MSGGDEAENAGRRGERTERTLAASLILPAVLLAWPGPFAPLAGDPFPMLAAAALASLASAGTLALSLARGARLRALPAFLFLAFSAAGLTSLALQPATDTLEASRASLLASVQLAALAGGASLGRSGRAWLARGLALVALLAVLPAMAGAASGFGGALGNSGSTSEVALLGAAAGACLFAREDGAWKWIGGCAAAAQAFYTGLAPVLAGAIVLAVVLVLIVATSPKARALSAAAALACAGLFGAGRLVPHPALPASPRPAAHAPGESGGLAVRAKIWASVPAMVKEYGALGAGPGQFRAAYPPYRDPDEIELSSHERTLPSAETEVEHAHSDLLQGFADAGWTGGALWIAFLAVAAWRALRVLAGGTSENAALAAAALAILGNSALREPLLWNAASSSAAFACFGALFASETSSSRRWTRVALPLAAALAVVAQWPRAWDVARHGRALARFAAGEGVEHAEAARAACEDSAPARAILARDLEARRGADSSPAVVAAWNEVLALRPHNLEALLQVGIAHARLGDADAARAAWEHARAVDPRHPALAGNLARMEALVGDPAKAIERLSEARADVTGSLGGFAVVALREGNVERGWELLALADERFSGLSAEQAYEIARGDESGLAEDARLALEGSAHLAWARQHASSGDFANAVRSYRQAKRCLTPRDGGVCADGVRMELAAALAKSERLEEARAEFEGVEASVRELAALPDWAGQALFEHGMLAR